jgi:hypothetical protein
MRRIFSIAWVKSGNVHAFKFRDGPLRERLLTLAMARRCYPLTLLPLGRPMGSDTLPLSPGGDAVRAPLVNEFSSAVK